MTHHQGTAARVLVGHELLAGKGRLMPPWSDLCIIGHTRSMTATVSDARAVAEVLGDRPDDAAVDLLLGVTSRTWRRWVAGEVTPTAANSARLAAVVCVLEQLAQSYTTDGAVAWFARPHPRLDGRRPADLLDDPDARRRLVAAAAGSKDTIAT